MFEAKDNRQIEQKGISKDAINKQISSFITGFPFMEICKPATIGDGILEVSDAQIDEFVATFDGTKNIDLMKFVPASGAASRMFKALFEFASLPKSNSINDKNYLSQFPFIQTFIYSIKSFAFYDDLQEKLQEKGKSIAGCVQDGEYATIINALLGDAGLKYGLLPKGLLKFHRYNSDVRTPFEEHIVEGINYCSSQNNVKLHYTVSSAHLSGFQELTSVLKYKYEAEKATLLYIDFSQQKTSTDTIAVNPDNTPFRNADGSLLFRPGGHGALIENLNDIEADVVFIKNIDNVVPDKLKAETYKYKKLIGGILINYKNKIHSLYSTLVSENVDKETLSQAEAFLRDKLCFIPHESYNSLTISDKAKYVAEKLNRPLRVCGMVKNEGEPGGGPFWAENSDGTISLQIVEGAQIDGDSSSKQKILTEATHFNPVDIVCYLKDIDGNKFDLKQFIDHKTGFISEKSKDGKTLKALELPGLWNGAMAYWNTIFVEVPIITFNPVKTINDLLRVEHQ